MTPPNTPTPRTDAACEVPLVEQLRSVPKDWREMREVGSCHHRNVPYGAMMHRAADRISQLERELSAANEQLAAAREELRQENENIVRLEQENAALRAELDGVQRKVQLWNDAKAILSQPIDASDILDEIDELLKKP